MGGFGAVNRHGVLSSSRVGSAIGSAQGPRDIPKFSKVQPYARPDLDPGAFWTRPARPAVVAPASRAATAFIHQMKEPDEGWHSRIM
ncbi:hypothetical protein ATE68_05395 [Sphingopyxis sp. H038]|nr:hypothetical protein ATE78_20860 [Sphingopyxis sp. H012]KTE36289.1 hypothetical protein ATE68_05395 [Sphingopyxis sp. H038]KTE40466.1 hypothetical protein ATE73_16475 [Sphingopyxis sp. H077]KTE66208.1 hypothetical protein ATE74_14805 [Sphingopyxis sp. H085]